MYSLRIALLFLFVASATLPFSSCNRKEDLEVCHEVVNPLAQINESIHFVNCSKGAETFSWDFGDGSTTSEF